MLPMLLLAVYADRYFLIGQSDRVDHGPLGLALSWTSRPNLEQQPACMLAEERRGCHQLRRPESQTEPSCFLALRISARIKYTAGGPLSLLRRLRNTTEETCRASATPHSYCWHTAAR